MINKQFHNNIKDYKQFHNNIKSQRKPTYKDAQLNLYLHANSPFQHSTVPSIQFQDRSMVLPKDTVKKKSLERENIKSFSKA